MATQPAGRAISVANKLLFAAPAFALACAAFFNSAFQTKFYVDDLRMKPDDFALVYALVRSLDMLGTPILGWIVDSSFFYAPPWLVGRRKPLLLLTAPLVATGFFLLYSPPSFLTHWELSVWYCTVASVYYFLPLVTSYQSLGAELSSTYDERTHIFGYVHVLACLGMVVAALAPGLVSWATNEPHTFSFPLFALTVAAVEVLSVAALALNVRVVDPLRLQSGAGRGSDGWLWEQPVHLPRDSLRKLAPQSFAGAGGEEASSLSHRPELWSSCVFTCGVRRRRTPPAEAPVQCAVPVTDEMLSTNLSQSLFGRIRSSDWMVVRVPLLIPRASKAPPHPCGSCFSMLLIASRACINAVTDAVFCVSCRCCCRRSQEAPTSAAAAVRLSALRAAAEAVGYGASAETQGPWLRSEADVWVVCLPAVSTTAAHGAKSTCSSGAQPEPVFHSVTEAGVEGMVDVLYRTSRASQTRTEGTSLEQALPLIPGVSWALSSLPMRVFLALSTTRIVASLCSMSFIAFYVQYVLRPPNYELWAGAALTAELVGSIASTPLWSWVSEVTDQRGAWMISSALAIPAMVAAFMFIGQGGVVWFVVYALWYGLTEGGAQFLFAAIRNSVVDYDALYLQQRREGQLLNYVNLLSCWVAIPASGVPLFLLANAGYLAGEASQNDAVAYLLRVFVLAVPAAFISLGWFCAACFPISRAEHVAMFLPPVADSVDSNSETRPKASNRRPPVQETAPPTRRKHASAFVVNSGLTVDELLSAASVSAGSVQAVTLPLARFPRAQGFAGTGDSDGSANGSASGDAAGASAPASASAAGFTDLRLPLALAVGQSESRRALAQSEPATGSETAELRLGDGHGSPPFPGSGPQAPQPERVGRFKFGPTGKVSESISSPASEAVFDVIAQRFALPAEVYRAASSDWLLDYFSRGTLQQVLAHRAFYCATSAMHRRRTLEPEPERPGDVEADPFLPARMPEPALPHSGSATVLSVPATTAFASLGFLGSLAPPQLYIPLYVREALFCCLWLAGCAVCLWVIVGLFGSVGAGHFPADKKSGEIARWPVLLGFAASGICAMCNGLRIIPAMKLANVESHSIERYLDLHDRMAR